MILTEGKSEVLLLRGGLNLINYELNGLNTCILRTFLQCSHALSHIILILPKSYCYPCFTDEKIKLEVDLKSCLYKKSFYAINGEDRPKQFF